MDVRWGEHRPPGKSRAGTHPAPGEHGLERRHRDGGRRSAATKLEFVSTDQGGARDRPRCSVGDPGCRTGASRARPDPSEPSPRRCRRAPRGRRSDRAPYEVTFFTSTTCDVAEPTPLGRESTITTNRGMNRCVALDRPTLTRGGRSSGRRRVASAAALGFSNCVPGRAQQHLVAEWTRDRPEWHRQGRIPADAGRGAGSRCRSSRTAAST